MSTSAALRDKALAAEAALAALLAEHKAAFWPDDERRLRDALRVVGEVASR